MPLPMPPATLAPIIEPSEEFDVKYSHSTLSEMSLENVPIRELTGLAETLGISQDDCYEAAELRKKIEEKR